MTTDGRFYRYWPAALTALGGLALVAMFSSFIGSAFHDHDTGVLMAFVTGMLGGVPVGLLAVVVWSRRNPPSW